MKIGIVLQVFTILYQYKMVTAIYGFGDEPEDPKRVRIYLEDDEKLLVPENSKVEYVSPVAELDEEVIWDKPPNFFNKQPNLLPYVSKVIKKQLYLPSQSLFHKQVPAQFYGKQDFTLENLRIKSDFDQSHSAANLLGGYLGNFDYGYHNAHALPHAAVFPGMQQHPVSVGKLLRPIVLFPNGWIQGVNFGVRSDIKPVREEQPDDLKYDFRTKTHSIR